MKKLPRNNKRGVTLVEVVIGVFVLSIFALGILSLLIYNNQAVADSARDKADYSAAMQKLDTVIAAISHGPDSGFVNYTGEGREKRATGLAEDKLEELIGVADEQLETSPDYYGGAGSSTIRGWYITLDYSEELTVKGYAANTLGAFDE